MRMWLAILSPPRSLFRQIWINNRRMFLLKTQTKNHPSHTLRNPKFKKKTHWFSQNLRMKLPTSRILHLLSFKKLPLRSEMQTASSPMPKLTRWCIKFRLLQIPIKSAILMVPMKLPSNSQSNAFRVNLCSKISKQHRPSSQRYQLKRPFSQWIRQLLCLIWWWWWVPSLRQ